MSFIVIPVRATQLSLIDYLSASGDSAKQAGTHYRKSAGANIMDSLPQVLVFLTCYSTFAG